MHSGRHDWLSHVCDHVKDGQLDNKASHVAHMLAVHYVNGGLEAWPSQPELASRAGLSGRTVLRALHDLEQHGFLAKRKGWPASTNGNVYTLTTPPNSDTQSLFGPKG